VVVKVYHDGSGTDNGSEFITLAGFCGASGAWDQIEPQISDILERHDAPREDGIRYLHMKEAWRGVYEHKGPFADWDWDRLSRLVMDLLPLVTPTDLQFFSCTVRKADFAAVKTRLDRVKDEAQICAQACFGALRIPQYEEKPEPLFVYLYYDVDEPFLKYVDRYWRNCKSSKQKGWKHQTKEIRAIRRLQAVSAMSLTDAAAWTINRHYSAADCESWYQILQMATLKNQSMMKLGQKELIKLFGSGGKLAPPKEWSS